MHLSKWIMIVVVASFLQQCHSSATSIPNNNNSKPENMDSTQKKNPFYSNTDSSKVNVPDEEWKKILPQEVYNIARQKGTERPWTSKYENSKEIGTYYCAVCGNPLFRSDTKFESGCGWPSFYEPISKGSIIYTPDHTYG